MFSSRGLVLLLGTVLITAMTAAKADGEEGMTADKTENAIGAITMQSIPPTTVLSLPMTGSYQQMGDAIAKVMAYVMPKGIIRGGPFGVYHSNPETTAEDSLAWEICVPVAQGAAVEAPFVVRELPAMEAAVVMCTGPYDKVAPCYGALSAWIAQNGYAMAGPPQEHWLSDPKVVPPGKLLTRILFPAVKREP